MRTQTTLRALALFIGVTACSPRLPAADASAPGLDARASDGAASDSAAPDSCVPACVAPGAVCEGRDRVTCEEASGCLIEATETCAHDCADGACCGTDGEPCCADGACAEFHDCVEGRCMNRCPDNPCVGMPNRFCVDNSEYYCWRYPSDPCPSHRPRECGEGDAACDPATGTCHGCDPNGPCFEQPEGRWVCTGFSGGHPVAGRCSIVDGCGAIVEHRDCVNTCAYNSGCCGTAGEACCGARVPPCEGGLTCTDGVCS